MKVIINLLIQSMIEKVRESNGSKYPDMGELKIRNKCKSALGCYHNVLEGHALGNMHTKQQLLRGQNFSLFET